MSYAEEVLVTKTELEEKKQRMSELETQASHVCLCVHVFAFWYGQHQTFACIL